MQVDYKTGEVTVGYQTPRWILTSDYFPAAIAGTLPGSSVRCVYSAGFATIPADLQRVCGEIVVSMVDYRQATMGSETLGSYSYSLQSAMDAVQRAPLTTKRILDMYRDRRF